MFARYYIPARSADVHITNRIEQKPHDPADAARLHGELKRLAEEEVVEAVTERFGAHNELTAVVVDSQTDYLKNARIVRVMFKLNGRQHSISMSKDAYMDRRELYREIGRVLVDEMTQIVGASLMIR